MQDATIFYAAQDPILGSHLRLAQDIPLLLTATDPLDIKEGPAITFYDGSQHPHIRPQPYNHTQTETDRDRQRQTETDRQKRQTKTDRDRRRQTETD